MIHFIVPMSGQGTRYQKAGYTQPKPLIPISGRPIIERLLQKIPIEWPSTFILAENHRNTDLPKVLSQLRPNGKQIFIPTHSKGPSFALQSAMGELQNLPASIRDLPILVSYCDYGMKWDPWDFNEFVQKSQCHCALISYRGFHAHYLSPQTYAYSRLEGEKVLEVREKGSFTDQRENEFASAGGYYFNSLETLAHGIKLQEKMGLILNGEYYTSLTIEALLRSQNHNSYSSSNTNSKLDVRIYEIPAFYQWGTPEDLQSFEYWEKTFHFWTYNLNNSNTQDALSVDHVHMPMAGLGSRFKNHFNTPKPFLFIDETPMYRMALESLPKGNSTSYVSLQSASSLLSLKEQEQAHFLEETPPGQAFTVQAGLKLIPERGDLIISACDHSLVLEPEVWKQFKIEPDCDAAIFTIQGYPGALRRPQAFAYVQTLNHASSNLKKKVTENYLRGERNLEFSFSLVQSVSVKVPISDHPHQDPLLVGTFWFKNKSILEKSLEQLIQSNRRVNGELYLDSIFNILIENGYKVRTIPLAGYVNWGDPDSLAEALYWKEIFMGHRLSKRQRLEGVHS